MREWFDPWLRQNMVERMRAEHVARWSFNTGDVVVREWCSLCGTTNHYGVILRFDRSRPAALVRLTCREEPVKLNPILLKRVLAPYPKGVLELVEGRGGGSGRPINKQRKGG
jgi:hypothetical protein